MCVLSTTVDRICFYRTVDCGIDVSSVSPSSEQSFVLKLIVINYLLLQSTKEEDALFSLL